jgi:hypothetical protein
MAVATSSDTKGFFRSLYDFGFTSLIGTRFLKFVYGLLVILASLAEIVVVISLLSQKSDAFSGNVVTNHGGAFAILSVLYYFMTLIWLRISIEFLIVFFQIGDNVRAMRAGGLELSSVDAWRGRARRPARLQPRQRQLRTGQPRRRHRPVGSTRPATRLNIGTGMASRGQNNSPPKEARRKSLAMKIALVRL